VDKKIPKFLPVIVRKFVIFLNCHVQIMSSENLHGLVILLSKPVKHTVNRNILILGERKKIIFEITLQVM
jgi:hypothetical protein